MDHEGILAKGRGWRAGQGAIISAAMTTRHRLTRTLLLTVFTAAAVGRAELGADTEASVIFTPAFAAAVPVALVASWLAAGQFGHAAVAGWLRAGAATALVLAVAGLIAPLAVPLLGGVATGPTDLLSVLPAHPLAWGAVLAGLVSVQVIALRQNRDAAGAEGIQSRK